MNNIKNDPLMFIQSIQSTNITSNNQVYFDSRNASKNKITKDVPKEINKDLVDPSLLERLTMLNKAHLNKFEVISKITTIDNIYVGIISNLDQERFLINTDEVQIDRVIDLEILNIK